MPERSRIVVALPDPMESHAVADWLAAERCQPVVRPTPRAAADEMRLHAFDLLVADLDFAVRGLRAGGRQRNPRTPAILIGPAGAGNGAASTGQAMLVTRPLDRGVLTCFVSMALLDGRPPRRSPRKTIDRFDALAGGIRSVVVDVSAEGLRLDVPRDGKTIPPPVFAVRLPMVGIGVTVRRMWMRSSASGSVLTCGVELSQNPPVLEDKWRAFVETVPQRRESCHLVD